MTAAGPLRPRAPHPGLGGPLLHLAVTTSTNDRARELAREGAPAGTVVVAEEQTAGRGRQGRRWSTPRGTGLTVSVVHRLGDPEPPGAAGLLPLASGLAVCDACESVSAVSCQLKWPNDVLIEGRKVAGILIEGRSQERWAVIGIGLNVDLPREELSTELQATATSLRIETGAPVARDAALEALCSALADRLGQLRSGDFDGILRAFGERDALFGRSVRWSASRGETGQQVVAGKAQGVDGAGRLIVVTDAGERTILDAGEIHLERHAGDRDEP
jgi:BirA family biotin operon repressor/biotin-[acetyl-CoA-carboxylase] ligase